MTCLLSGTEADQGLGAGLEVEGRRRLDPETGEVGGRGAGAEAGAEVAGTERERGLDLVIGGGGGRGQAVVKVTQLYPPTSPGDLQPRRPECGEPPVAGRRAS